MGKTKIKERKLGKVPPQEELKKLPKDDNVIRGPGSSDDLKKLLPQPDLANILEREVGTGDNLVLLADTFEKMDLKYKKLLEGPEDLIDKIKLNVLDATKEIFLKSDGIQAFIDLILTKNLSGPSFNKPTGTNQRHRVITGLFLSSLINQSPDKDIKLDVRKILPLDHLCYKVSNKREVQIEGDVGDFFGSDSADSVFVVNGNAGYFVGSEIDGATIVVKGHANVCGKSMKSGNIIVEQDLSRDPPWDKEFCGVSTPDHVHVSRNLVGKEYVKNWRQHLIEWEKQKSKSGN